MDSPLDTSRTVVDDQDLSQDYFVRRIAHDDIITEDNIDRVISRVQSFAPSAGQIPKDFNGSVERDLELQSVSSNETIAAEDDALTKSKQGMFSQDGGLEFPEGGRKAYTVLFGCFLGLIPCFGMVNITGVIQTHVSENILTDTPSSTVAWIFSIFLFLNFLTSIFSGTFFDRNGARVPLVLGGVLQVCGIVATANCTEVWQFILAFSILVGVGGGLTISPLIGCIAHYFNKRRGLMSSLASTGGSIGGIIFPIMLRQLYVEVKFQWAMRILALIYVFCYGLSVILVKERLPNKKFEGSRLDNLKSYLQAVDIKGLLDSKFMFTVLGCSFAEAAALIIATYHASYARAQGCSESTAYLMISLSHVGGIPGRWITGFMADKIGRFNVMATTLLAACAILLIILIPFGSHPAAIYVFSVSWGFATGSIFSLLPVCCGQISKTQDFGRRYGTMYFVASFGTLVCIPIAGAIIGDESQIGYRNMIIYGAMTALGSCIFYIIARIKCVGATLKTKF